MKIELKEYEEYLTELKNIVNELNNAEIGLDESIKLYTRGIKIHKALSDVLEEEKLNIISLEDGILGEEI